MYNRSVKSNGLILKIFATYYKQAWVNILNWLNYKARKCSSGSCYMTNYKAKAVLFCVSSIGK